MPIGYIWIVLQPSYRQSNSRFSCGVQYFSFLSVCRAEQPYNQDNLQLQNAMILWTSCSRQKNISVMVLPSIYYVYSKTHVYFYYHTFCVYVMPSLASCSCRIRISSASSFTVAPGGGPGGGGSGSGDGDGEAGGGVKGRPDDWLLAAAPAAPGGCV